MERLSRTRAIAAFLMPLLVVAVTAAVLVGTLDAPFGSDDSYVIAKSSSPDLAERAFAFNIDRPSPGYGAWYEGMVYQRRYVRILPSLLLSAEVRLFGQEPVPLHLASLFLHLCNALLLYGLLLRWLGNSTTAGLSALVFGVHLAAGEVVGWLCCQPLIVAATFSLLSFWALLWYRRRGGMLPLFAFALATLAAVTSYEAAVALPLLLVVCDRRLTRGLGGCRWVRWAPAAVSFAALATLGGITWWFRHGLSAPDTSYHPTLPMVWRAGRIDLANYWLKSLGIVRPGSTAYWLYNLVGEPAALGVAVSAMALALVAAWRSRVARFGLLVFSGFLAPPFLMRIFASTWNNPTLRQLYLPSLGLAVLAAGLLSWPRPWRFRALVAGFVIVLSTINVLAWPTTLGRPLREAALKGLREALAGTDPARPVVMIGSFYPVSPFPAVDACLFEVSLARPGPVGWYAIPRTTTGHLPQLEREGARTLLASAPEGLDVPTETYHLAVPPPGSGRYHSGGLRGLVEPPTAVRLGSQRITQGSEGATVEVAAHDAGKITALRYTFDRPLDAYTFIGVETCRKVRRVTFD